MSVFGVDGFGNTITVDSAAFLNHARELKDSMKNGPAHTFYVHFGGSEQKFDSLDAIELPLGREVTIVHFHGLFQDRHHTSTLHNMISEVAGVCSIFVEAQTMILFDGSSGASYFPYYSYNNESCGNDLHFLHADNDIIETSCLDSFAGELARFLQGEIEVLGINKVYILGVSQGGNVAAHVALLIGGTAILWRSVTLKYSRDSVKFRRTRILNFSGQADDVFTPSLTHAVADELSDMGHTVFLKFYDVDHYNDEPDKQDEKDIVLAIKTLICGGAMQSHVKLDVETRAQLIVEDKNKYIMA
jgi:predicted esterase